MSQPEILVHAAAPSHGPDDVRYRKEALAITGFEACKRHDILGGTRQKQRVQERQQTLQDAQQTWQDTQQSPVQAQDSVTSKDPAPGHQVTNAFSTWVTPILARPSPQVLVGRTPAPLHLKRASGVTGHVPIQQTPINHQRPITAPSEPSIIKETPLLRRSFSDAFDTPPSEIPDSQPTPKRPQHGERPFEETSSPSPVHREEPHAKKWKADNGGDPLLGLGDGTPPDDTSTPAVNNGPQPSSTPPHDDIITPAPPSSASTALTTGIPAYRRRKVDSPPPEPSLRSTMPSQLTASLKILQQQCSKILETVQPLRAIEDWERGYWQLTFEFDNDEAEDNNNWNTVSREKMWEWLASFIARGCGGWGTWAIFEEGRLERFDGEDGWMGEMGDQEPVIESGDGPAFGRVKVFCWGEVVSEIYVLLFLATNRRVKRCGAQWIDWYGQAVVVVGGS